MTFWLSRIDRAISNCLYIILLIIIIADIKLYLSDLYVYPPLPGIILL